MTSRPKARERRREVKVKGEIKRTERVEEAEVHDRQARSVSDSQYVLMTMADCWLLKTSREELVECQATVRQYQAASFH